MLTVRSEILYWWKRNLSKKRGSRERPTVDKKVRERTLSFMVTYLSCVLGVPYPFGQDGEVVGCEELTLPESRSLRTS